MAAVGVLAAAVASLWLALWPGYYQGVAVESRPASQGVTAAEPPTREFRASLIKINGLKIIPVLVFPVAIAAVAYAAARWRDLPGSKAVLWANAGMLIAFCLLALTSVGMFYVPAAVFLLSAATLNQWMPVPAHRVAGAGQSQADKQKQRR
jgi:hypothetical protein